MAKGSHIIAFKTADTSRASTTTPTADPDLVLSLLPNTDYLIVGCLLATSGAGGLRVSGTSVAGSWSLATGDTSGTTGDVGYSITLSGQFRGITPDTSGNGSALWFRGYISTSGAPINFEVLWAQETSNATASIMKEGSWLKAIQMST